MSAGSLARRYAKALLVLGIEEGNADRVGRELSQLGELVHESTELSEALSNPAFARADREKVLLALADKVGATGTIKNFLRLLVDRERVTALPDIARELELLIDEHAGRVRAVVTTARPLSGDQETRLTAALEKVSGKKIILEKREDPDLLGGAVAKVGDTVYDGSLSTQLREMRRGLIR